MNDPILILWNRLEPDKRTVMGTFPENPPDGRDQITCLLEIMDKFTTNGEPMGPDFKETAFLVYPSRQTEELKAVAELANHLGPQPVPENYWLRRVQGDRPVVQGARL